MDSEQMIQLLLETLKVQNRTLEIQAETILNLSQKTELPYPLKEPQVFNPEEEDSEEAEEITLVDLTSLTDVNTLEVAGEIDGTAATA